MTQVRKNAYVAEAGEEYHPDRHRSCTIYAGTLVQQVCNSHAPVPSFCCCSFSCCSCVSSTSLSMRLCIYPSVRLSVCPSVCYLSVCLSVCLSLHHIAVAVLCSRASSSSASHLPWCSQSICMPLCAVVHPSQHVCLVEPVPASLSVSLSVCLFMGSVHKQQLHNQDTK